MAKVRRLIAETAGGLPRTFWYLWAGTLISRLTAFVLIFLAFYLTQTRGFSPGFAGLVIGLSGGGGAVGVLVGGVLADRWGRRPTILLAHLSAATAMLGLGLSTSQLAIALWATAVGMFGNMVRPAFSAMMVDVVPERDRVRAWSLNYWAINLGFSVAAALAGFAAQVDYLLLFALDAATTLIAALIVFVKVAETKPAAPPARTAAARPDGLRTVFTDRVFMAFVGLTLLTSVILMQHLSALPMAMQRDGLAPSVFGSVIALNGVVIVLGQFVVTRLLRGQPRTRILAMAAVTMGFGFGLNAIADGPLLYGVTVIVWTIGEMAGTPQLSAVVAELAPAHLRGRYQSLVALAWSTAAFLAPLIGGVVIERFGDAPLWIGCFALGVVAAVGHLATGPARERRAAAIRAATPPQPAPPGAPVATGAQAA